MSQTQAQAPPPSSLSDDSVPSSFDDQPGFFEENRWGKFTRRLREEPLIPLGCLATCYALYAASRSIRSGNAIKTNQMFRARVYAQGFTLAAIVLGSVFYQDERLKRRQFDKVVEDKKAAEKREKWIAELEARDREDREWRANFEQISQRAKEAESELQETMRGRKRMAEEGTRQVGRAAKEKLDKSFKTSSVYEGVILDGYAPGFGLWRTREAWRRR